MNYHITIKNQKKYKRNPWIINDEGELIIKNHKLKFIHARQPNTIVRISNALPSSLEVLRIKNRYYSMNYIHSFPKKLRELKIHKGNFIKLPEFPDTINNFELVDLGLRHLPNNFYKKRNQKINRFVIRSNKITRIPKLNAIDFEFHNNQLTYIPTKGFKIIPKPIIHRWYQPEGLPFHYCYNPIQCQGVKNWILFYSKRMISSIKNLDYLKPWNINFLFNINQNMDYY